MLQKNPRRTVLQRAQHHRIVHARGDHENPASEPGASRSIEKERSLFMPEIVIQQNHVDFIQLRQCQRFTCRSAGARNLEVRLGL